MTQKSCTRFDDAERIMNGRLGGVLWLEAMPLPPSSDIEVQVPRLQHYILPNTTKQLMLQAKKIYISDNTL